MLLFFWHRQSPAPWLDNGDTHIACAAIIASEGGLQYGTVSEDYWTGHHAHWRGWDSAYLRKDFAGVESERFRLAEGTVPGTVAASLAQRKRWHRGGVEVAARRPLAPHHTAHRDVARLGSRPATRP